jgi:hypothetical protein
MNRYLAMLKNDSGAAVLRDLPFILAREIAVWGWLVLMAPATLPILWSRRRLLSAALAKRRVLRARIAADAGAEP